MNHAVFCVTPIARPISWLLTPFLQLVIIQTVGNHLSKPSGESSKIVPVFSENFRSGCFVVQVQPCRVLSK